MTHPTWGARLAELLLRQSAPRRVPDLHEMDEVQRAIHRRAYSAGMEDARRRRPTAAEARMALLEALDAEVRVLRAQLAREGESGMTGLEFRGG